MILEHCKCRVPHGDSLGSWVSLQRVNLKGIRDDPSSYEDYQIERFNILNNMGFDWEVNRHGDEDWENMRIDLEAFKLVNGHCNASTLDSDNKQLGNWVFTQRKALKGVRDDQSAFKERQVRRFHLLDEMGFAWEIGRGYRNV